MTITLQPEQEQLITDALQSGVYQTPDEVIKRALEMLHAGEEWLWRNRQAIDAKIHRGIEQLDRGEGISEEELDSYLAALKKSSE
jgi:putative addiction module CopG family antidote